VEKNSVISVWLFQTPCVRKFELHYIDYIVLCSILLYLFHVKHTWKHDTLHSGTYAVKAQLVCMLLLPVLGDFLPPPHLLSSLPSLLINISLTGPIGKVVLLYQPKRRDLSWNRLRDNMKKKMQWKVQYELSRSPFTQIPISYTYPVSQPFSHLPIVKNSSCESFHTTHF